MLYRLKRKGNIITMTIRGRNTNPAKRGACIHYSTFARKRLSDLLYGLDFSMTDFVTLTYNNEGYHVKTSKRHLQNFFKAARRKYPRMRYIWAQEFQARGAIHFHVLVDVPLPVKKALIGDTYRVVLNADWWPYGVAVVEPVNYDGGLSKYLCDDVAKENQREGHYFAGRWWGNSRGLVPRGEWVVGDNIAALCPGLGVGNPLYKWKGNLNFKNTGDIFYPVFAAITNEEIVKKNIS